LVYTKLKWKAEVNKEQVGRGSILGALIGDAAGATSGKEMEQERLFAAKPAEIERPRKERS